MARIFNRNKGKGTTPAPRTWSKGVSFTSAMDAREYSNRLQRMGRITAIHQEPETKTYIVYVGLAEEESLETTAIPGTLKELVEMETGLEERKMKTAAEVAEREARLGTRARRKVAAGTKRIGRGTVRGIREELITGEEFITGEAYEKPLRTMTKGKSPVAGMRASLPTPGTTPGYKHFARIGIMKAAKITEDAVGVATPRIATAPGMPRIATEPGRARIATGMGSPRITTEQHRTSGFAGAVPLEKFQVPYMRRRHKDKESEE